MNEHDDYMGCESSKKLKKKLSAFKIFLICWTVLFIIEVIALIKG